jgi:sensor histidine kinase YesM
MYEQPRTEPVNQPEETILRLNDRKVRLIGIPLISILIPLITEFEHGLQDLVFFSMKVLVTFFITVTFWEGNRHIILRVRRKFPAYEQTKQRLLAEALMALVYTFIATHLLEFVLGNFVFKREVEIGYRITLITTVLVYLVYEAIYFFEAWKLNVRTTEALTRQQVESQLEVLKNQLDPHFLFNSMNTLAALIDDSNTNAQQYLERQSDVYRYVLLSRTQNTVQLKEEMDFLDAYTYLNKIRFRDNLLIEQELSPECLRRYVAPLSIQMLVENAIKHNVISKEYPLKIRLREEEGDYLVVENTIQKKNILEKSTKVGLQNIVNRYALLTDRPVTVSEEGGVFVVRVPLLTE